MISNEKVVEIIKFASINGDNKTYEMYGLTKETLKRYRRKYKTIESDGSKLEALAKIVDNYDENTIKKIANENKQIPFEKPIINFDGELFRFGLVTDTHFGSIYFEEYKWDSVCAELEKQNIKKLIHCGDVVDGMSNIPGHIYELTHLGYDKQKKYALNQLLKYHGDIYLIDGNHDRWFMKSNGAIIVSDICGQHDNLHYLGQDEGDLEINGVKIKLWHGEDGSSYATSYRLQKIIEAFYGGEKPQILLCGHVHKSLYLFERNIHCISSGCLQNQSSYMRRRRMPAHTGWWIIEIMIKDKEVKSFTCRFYPFYK